MAKFRYTAKRGPNDVVEGLLEAETRGQVLNRLADLGYTAMRIDEEVLASSSTSRALRPRLDGRIAARHLNVFSRQLGSLVRSSVPLLRALGILCEQTTHPSLRRLLGAVTEDVRQGDALSDALAKHPRVFSPLYVSLVRSGEVGGALDVVFDRLVTQADEDEALRTKVYTALAYPLFIGIVGAGTVLFLLAFVLPRLLRLFEGFGSQLPLPTRLLLALSEFVSQPWFWGLLVAAAIGLVMLRGTRGSAVDLMLQRVILRLPLIGTLIRQLDLARFARSFGLLLEHGIPLLQAVEVAIPVVHHRVIRRELTRLPSFLMQGSSLAACLKELDVVSPFMVNTVAVGEEGGKVAEALAEVATFYEREAARSLQVASALLEPTVVLMVGAVVGFIVMAVLLPIFELGTMAR